MVRASGCRVWDADGREYVDYVMALGAVALGYGHPAVNRAAEEAIAAGVVGPLPPVLEEELAEALCHRIPWIERVRFLKTGAEAVAAAVRLARVVTGRERVLGCGYHGWLDWCQGAEGVPAATRALYAELPFNDPERTRRLIRDAGDRLAVVVVEPVVVTEPTREWLEVVQAETRRVGAVLVFDEIKTAFRLAVGGAAERYGVRPDLVVLGEALAAAAATLEVMERDNVCAHLHAVGTRLLHGLHRLHQTHGDVVTGVGGIAEMCFVHFVSEPLSRDVARGCAARGLLFKRTAYNFVSLAHDEVTVDRTLAILEDVLGAIG